MSDFIALPVKRGIEEIKPILSVIDGLGFIAGGYARHCVSPNVYDAELWSETFEDIDIFASSVENFNRLKAKFEFLDFEQTRETCFAYTYKTRYNGLEYYPIQLIKPVRTGSVGSVEFVLSHFDFTITMAGVLYDPNESIKILVHKDFERDELRKRLVIKNITNPVVSALRFMKYYGKGYNTTLSEVSKLFVAWDKMRDKIVNYVYEAASTDPDTLTPDQREGYRQLFFKMLVAGE